jgi:uncharacterized membrane protein YbaN (DUF454 family)
MMKYIILKLLGGVSLTLGVLGAFLPLLPSTCFILLATWAFSKSSPQFHGWLYCRSPFSISIQNWQQHRVIPKKAKLMALLSLVSSFGLSAMFVSNGIVLITLGLGMMLLLAYLLTRSSDVESQLGVYTTSNHIR